MPRNVQVKGRYYAYFAHEWKLWKWLENSRKCAELPPTCRFKQINLGKLWLSAGWAKSTYTKYWNRRQHLILVLLPFPSQQLQLYSSKCIRQLNWICKTEMWPKTSGPESKKCASHKWIFTGKALQSSASVVIFSSLHLRPTDFHLWQCKCASSMEIGFMYCAFAISNNILAWHWP